MTFARETSSWISEFTRRDLINRQPNTDVDAPGNVRCWHLADNPTAPAFVRFRTKAGKVRF